VRGVMPDRTGNRVWQDDIVRHTVDVDDPFVERQLVIVTRGLELFIHLRQRHDLGVGEVAVRVRHRVGVVGDVHLVGRVVERHHGGPGNRARLGEVHEAIVVHVLRARGDVSGLAIREAVEMFPVLQVGRGVKHFNINGQRVPVDGEQRRPVGRGPDDLFVEWHDVCLIDFHVK